MFEFAADWKLSTRKFLRDPRLSTISGHRSDEALSASVRFLLDFQGDVAPDLEEQIVSLLHDKMTHCRYTEPIRSFQLAVATEDVYDVEVMECGKAALKEANDHLGLAFDDWDLEYYTDLFCQKVGRNPTNVECFDLAQSNREHSRHWFFKGRMVVDGEERSGSLFSMVMDTQCHSNQNNVIKFSDNSSAIKGFPVDILSPRSFTEPSSFHKDTNLTRHIIFTAETHNFPTGVAPFPGATTGTGGRIRDVQATGRGAHVIAGSAGYCFGNLLIPGYTMPWEDSSFIYPGNFARPLDIAIEASNGASDYGNKFGEPVLTGFSRSFGLMIGRERREWVKPIMFSGGIGSLSESHVHKEDPEIGMHVVKVGGPVYRIGVGGGAASSVQVQGDNASELDLGAVQRGDPEMEQKMNRVIRACIEMHKDNPICSIHDQGAGGNGNVLKEICEPVGAVINAGSFQLGDPTLSVMEIWGAEYQESNAFLARKKDRRLLEEIATREKCPISFVGRITGDGKVRLVDDLRSQAIEPDSKKMKKTARDPVDLHLDHVLGKMPTKVFKLDHKDVRLSAVQLPAALTVQNALERVLRLPSVASKRYLTNKVDRSVTGLVAQQQCVGPLHTPLADVAVVALSHFNTVGGATAIGEQPIKGLVNAAAGARMAVGESLTNLVFALITDLRDVKCSGNWMWAAKLDGEGALLYDACAALCAVMKQLGIAIDGGKDSLSMAARVNGETVKAPGALVVSVYAGCPDIRKTVTPDLKEEEGACLVYVAFSGSKTARLGGSALAQCFSQIGDETPDLDEPVTFAAAFEVTQRLIEGKKLLAGHDVSDGGLLTCVLEMAFAGNVGVNLNFNSTRGLMEFLFAEELGIVLQVRATDVDTVCSAYALKSVPCIKIGNTGSTNAMVSFNGSEVLNAPIANLRDVWEATSFQMERLQANPKCVEMEEKNLRERKSPLFKLTFDSKPSPIAHFSSAPRVAVIREEGSNGDREMVSSFHMAGFDVWDVNMHDLCQGDLDLNQFRGVAFVGGFSYADVFGSAKGWAATLKYQKKLKQAFEAFYKRDDTFSLGVCNGCQLMGLLGWVGQDSAGKQGLHLDHNDSERFESRFSTVRISASPSIMLDGMHGSVLGVWVAHGEGKMVFANDRILDSVQKENLVCLQYVDDEGHPTETYPLNPNGSRAGIAGVCSQDGRHLALMPHPERCVLPWQWPWQPESFSMDDARSPWFRMFQNAFNWCS
uniref:Phosphoribosylformylglycinamidine synthase n=1 Tax=Capitella teleta TaxID=283909 RepID=X1ZKR9_CAPTE